MWHCMQHPVTRKIDSRRIAPHLFCAQASGKWRMVAHEVKVTLAYWGFQFIRACIRNTGLIIGRKIYDDTTKTKLHVHRYRCLKTPPTAVGISPYGEKVFESRSVITKEDFETLDSKSEKKSGTHSTILWIGRCASYGERLSDPCIKDIRSIMYAKHIS